MPQTASLIDTLKQQLKVNGITYADIAKTLDISEASVKRLFSEQSFSLKRLESICKLAGLQLSELVHLMEQEHPQLQQLSIHQEKEIVTDPLLLMIAIYVVNHYSFDDLCQEIAVSEPDCIRKLAQLDRLKIISLLPNNRIKLLIAPNFRWQNNGPIQQFFQQHVKKDFFTSNFTKSSDRLLVLNGQLSDASYKEIQQQTVKLAKTFNELMLQDRRRPNEERKHITMVLASRPWEFSLFDQYRRKAVN